MSLLSCVILIVFLLVILCLTWFGLYHFARDIAQGIWWYGIPYIHTPENKIHAVLCNLNLKEWDVFIDIGCGDGKLLEAVKMKFPNTQVIGYEKSYRPYQDAERRKELNWLDYELRNRDFFTSDISNATVLYSYMINYIMEKIWEKVQKECQPWTLLYSNSFRVKSYEPKSTIELSKSAKIFIYEVP